MELYIFYEVMKPIFAVVGVVLLHGSLGNMLCFRLTCLRLINIKGVLPVCVRVCVLPLCVTCVLPVCVYECVTCVCVTFVCVTCVCMCVLPVCVT